MTLFLLILGLLFSVTSGHASTSLVAPFTCEERLAWHDQHALVLSRRFLQLPPLSHRYLTAATLETAEGEPLLAVGGYRSQHVHLEGATSLLNEWVDIPRPQPFRFKWLGEILVVNPVDQVAVGEVRKFRKGSGHWTRTLRHDPTHSNRVSNAVRLLLRTPLAPQIEPKAFSDWRILSPRDPHLFPGLDRFVQIVRALVASGSLKPKETPRHFMLEQAAAILGKLSILVPQRESPIELNATIADIRRKLSDPLVGLSFSLYLQILDNDSVDANCVRELRRFLEMQPEVAELPTAEWCYAGVIANELMSTVMPAYDQLIAEVEIFSLAN